MKGILDGVRIIDFTHGQAGPYAGQMLGDLGADVVHVEGPKHPDMTRAHVAVYGVSVALPDGRGSVFYQDHNRNKRAMTLDAIKDEGHGVFLDLVRNADVFLSNYRRQVLTRMGLEYRPLRETNQRLIYATGSGMGKKGADAERGSVDIVVDARSGMMMAGGEEGKGPSVSPVGIGDRSAAIFLAHGVLAALFHRERTGQGQELHVSQLMSMMTLAGNTISSYLWLGHPFPRANREHAINPIHNYYQCRDGRWIVLGHYKADKYWPAFCQATGLGRLANDPRFDTLQHRAEHAEELLPVIVGVFKSKTSKEWDETLSKADLLFAIVQEIPEVVNDPQVLANNYIIDFEHPVAGSIKMMGFPVEFSTTPCEVRRAPPALGEHTEEVLQEWCGYDWDKIVGLRERGVI